MTGSDCSVCKIRPEILVIQDFHDPEESKKLRQRTIALNKVKGLEKQVDTLGKLIIDTKTRAELIAGTPDKLTEELVRRRIIQGKNSPKKIQETKPAEEPKPAKNNGIMSMLGMGGSSVVEGGSIDQLIKQSQKKKEDRQKVKKLPPLVREFEKYKSSGDGLSFFNTVQSFNMVPGVVFENDSKDKGIFFGINIALSYLCSKIIQFAIFKNVFKRVSTSLFGFLTLYSFCVFGIVTYVNFISVELRVSLNMYNLQGGSSIVSHLIIMLLMAFVVMYFISLTDTRTKDEIKNMKMTYVRKSKLADKLNLIAMVTAVCGNGLTLVIA